MHTRVHNDDATDVVTAGLCQAQRQRTAHGEPDDENVVTLLPKACEGRLHFAEPIGPSCLLQVLPPCPVTWEEREFHAVAGTSERLRQWSQRSWGTGEAMTQQHADPAARGGPRFGSCTRRHAYLPV